MKSKLKSTFTYPFVLKAVLLCALLYVCYIKERNFMKTYATGVAMKTDVGYLVVPINLRP